MIRDYPLSLTTGQVVNLVVEGSRMSLRSTSSLTTGVHILAEAKDGTELSSVNLSEGDQLVIDGTFNTVRVSATADVDIVLAIGKSQVTSPKVVGEIGIKQGTRVETSAAVVTSVALEVLSVEAARKSVLIQNVDGVETVYIGGDNLTVENGMILSAGQSMLINSSANAEIRAVSESDSVHIRIMQELE